jgi:hypothetical protein
MHASGLQAPQAQASAIPPQAALQIQALIDDKAARTPVQDRIDSQLLYKHKMARGLPVAPGVPTLSVRTTTAADGREIVDVVATHANALVPAVQQLGADVLFADDRMLRLQTTLDSLESLASLPGVLFIHPALYPQVQSFKPRMTSDGRRRMSMPAPMPNDLLRRRLQSAFAAQQLNTLVAVDSEGDTTHKAKTARALYGVDGTGIKVGVISTGVDGLTDSQAAGALGAVTVLSGQAGQGNEGTAMLEIVHDLAPGAQLYFATGYTGITQFATNIGALQAAGCNIIVDDLLYLVESPFQDGQTAAVASTWNAGVVIQAVKDVTAAGVMYFSSAGNYGRIDGETSGTWEGDFVDSGISNPFGLGGTLNVFGVSGTTQFAFDQILHPGFAVTLSWDDPLGQSSNDYDLYLVDGTLGTVKGSSTNRQTGTQDPWEGIGEGGAVNDRIFVVKYSGSPRFLHLETLGGILSWQTTGSTHGHNSTTAATSFGVAATPAATAAGCYSPLVTPPGPYPNPFTAANAVECFSSDGPRRIFFNGDGSAITPNNFLQATNGGQVLAKPDFAAADGVSVSGAGYTGTGLDDVHTPFYGTSAAAPHAAAIAALVWSRDVRQSAAQVKADLVASAIDIMGTGVDRDSGAGILMADAAVGHYSCAYGIDRASQAIAASGGPTSVTVTAGVDCPWAATTAAPFVTITSGASGKGNGSVSMTVAANASGVARMASVTIAGQTFTINQDGGACSYRIDRASQAIDPSGGSTSVTVTATTGCAWTATTAAPFVNITSGASGNGNGTVSMTVAANNTGAARAADVTIAGQAFAITQNSVSPTVTLDRSALTFAALNNGTAFTAVTAGQAVHLTQSGLGTVTWQAVSNQPWLVVTPTSGATGTATLTVSTQFTPGLTATQSGSITITLSGAANAVGPVTITLNSIAPASALPPFGSFDTPTNGVIGVAGSIAVTGWTLDRVQVTRVTVCRDPVAGEPAPANGNCAGNAQIYIGDAVFVDGARPDVQADYPAYPLSSRAGWGYLMLTNFLPGLGNGTFTIRAYAYDMEGQTTVLGVKTITCDNQDSLAPFGAIDVPGQGAVTSGVVGNTGWVLAPRPNFADPPDGGIVNVFVDGTNVGSPGLWNARPDLTALFPALQYPGINQALGIFGLDTTTLVNGVHTIFWLVTGGPGGGTQGIGSRFFTVSNGAELVTPAAATASSREASQEATVIASRSTLDIPPAAAARIVSEQRLAPEIAAAPLDRAAIHGRRGFDLELPLRTYSSSAGAIDVQAEELDRVELHLGGAGHHKYSGYLQTAGGLKPLPVGSSLDASTGTFTWMPGVGFYGPYNLTFVRWSGANAVARQDVRITLNAKGSNRIGPQTVIDAPVSGATEGSPLFVGGWAADLKSTVDTGVNTVHVWAYPIDARGNRLDPIFIGPAIYGGARPDVAAIYGARFENSGYGIIVDGLAPGTYDIAVFAFSTVANGFTPARVVRIVVR